MKVIELGLESENIIHSVTQIFLQFVTTTISINTSISISWKHVYLFR